MDALFPSEIGPPDASPARRLPRFRFCTPVLAFLLALSPTLLGFSSHGAPAQNQRLRPGLSLEPSRLQARWELPDAASLRLRSTAALVMDAWSREVLYAHNVDAPASIASITKLMTAMVVLDADLPLDELVTIEEGDRDNLKHSASRLPIGWTLTRGELLHLALMSSDNRAAAALARTYPGGTDAFILAMNLKAQTLGLTRTSFADSSGLNPANVSTARDLARLTRAAGTYFLIRQMTTSDQVPFRSTEAGHSRVFGNSNGLVRDVRWEIGLTKTGYTVEAGSCLVMEAAILERPILMVLLDSTGKLSRIGDAERVRAWLESGARPPSSPHRWLCRPDEEGE
jgi:D-alanyl-D-alanine endopeptidase (penicillin-binding protein 7)